MSAYLVSPQHIVEIVKWAKCPQQGDLSHVYNQITKKEIDCDAEQMVIILAQANIDSLVARYKDDQNEYQSIFQDCLDILKYSTDGVSVSLLSGIGSCDLNADDIYNMVRCLNYQSCEVSNWVETDAYWLLNSIQDKAGSKMSKDANIQWSFED
jgi:hypothetical protein